jgi:hypothetical protein
MSTVKKPVIGFTGNWWKDQKKWKKPEDVKQQDVKQQDVNNKKLKEEEEKQKNMLAEATRDDIKGW